MWWERGSPAREVTQNWSRNVSTPWAAVCVWGEGRPSLMEEQLLRSSSRGRSDRRQSSKTGLKMAPAFLPLGRRWESSKEGEVVMGFVPVVLPHYSALSEPFVGWVKFRAGSDKYLSFAPPGHFQCCSLVLFWE